MENRQLNKDVDFLVSFCNCCYLCPLKPGAIQETKLNVWLFVFVFVFVFFFCISQVGAIQEGLANCGHLYLYLCLYMCSYFVFRRLAQFRRSGKLNVWA